MKTKLNLRSLLTVAGSSLLAMSSASAADLFWDGGTTDIAGNGNGVSDGGSGTWDTTISNWDAGNGVPYVAWNNANGDTARFAGTAGTVTVGSDVTASGLFFTAGGYTITGGTITMTGATISASTGTTTIASVIDRTGNLTKSSGGTLSLTNTANNITGIVSATGGVLEVTKMADAGESSSIGTSSFVPGNFNLNNGTTLRYIGSGDSTDRVARFGSAGSGNVTFDASGTGALNFTNTGVFAGTTNNGNTKTLNLIGTNTDNNTLAIQVTNIPVTDGTGIMGVNKDGVGTWVLTNSNAYTGATTINAGTLVITGATQATSSITFTGGSLGLDTASPVTAASADVDLTNGTIKVTGSTGAPSYTLLTAASITGTPVLADPVPGYELQIAAGGTELRLVDAGGASPYDTWSGGAAFGDDANGDGISNGLAFLLGAANPNISALDKLPTATESAGGLVLTFQMLDATARGTATLAIEHSSDLGITDAWTTITVPASSGTVDDVVFTITGTSPLNVTATIPVDKAADGKLFGRLKAQP